MNPVPAAIGIDLGGTHVKAGVYAANGTTLSRVTQPTRDTGSGAPAFVETIRALIDGFDAPDATVGLAAPGLAAGNGRAIAHMPGRLHGLEDLDWSDFLRRPVRVLNDAHAALLGERWLGAAQGLDDVVMLTLGTGVGGAVMSGGRLLRGRSGRAGHLGHVCLDPDGAPDIVRTPGSLEDAIGECSLPTRSGGRFSTTRELLAACASGVPGAEAIWEKSVRALGCALASFVNTFDPEAFVLGGGVARAGEGLFARLALVLDEVEWRPGGQRVRLLPAQLEEWAGACGAAWHALHSA